MIVRNPILADFITKVIRLVYIRIIRENPCIMDGYGRWPNETAFLFFRGRVSRLCFEAVMDRGGSRVAAICLG